MLSMRRWMVWALLSLLWGLQGVFAGYRHRGGQAMLELGIAAFFAVVGRVVWQRDPSR